MGIDLSPLLQPHQCKHILIDSRLYITALAFGGWFGAVKLRGWQDLSNIGGQEVDMIPSPTKHKKNHWQQYKGLLALHMRAPSMRFGTIVQETGHTSSVFAIVPLLRSIGLWKSVFKARHVEVPCMYAIQPGNAIQDLMESC